MINPNKLASEIKFYLDYSQYDKSLERYLTYEEAVDDVYNTHCQKYSEKLSEKPELLDLLDFAFDKYRNKFFLGSNRALQWSGDPLLKHEIKMYNCVSGPLDKLSKFGDIMYMLLGGCGVGFSVQKHHIGQLPKFTKSTYRGTADYIIEDSIEGWAASIYALIACYFEGTEWESKDIRFDYSQIRNKNTLIAGRFKAPGPEGLMKAHEKITAILHPTRYNDQVHIKPIQAYDIVMYIADAVISGGVRRSATICLFSEDDIEMKTAKTGDWFYKNPQRARSNNSMVKLRDNVSLTELREDINHIREYGEPGIVLVDDVNVTYNPCFTAGTKVLCNVENEHVPLFYTMKEMSKMTDDGIEFKVQGAKYNKLENKWERGWYNATAFKTGHRKIGSVLIIDENGNEFSVECTDNHKFALNDGEYVEARYLNNTDVVSLNGIKYTAEEFLYYDYGDCNYEDDGCDINGEDIYDLNVPETSNFYVVFENEYNDEEYCEILVHNCVEIGMYAYHHKTNESGWQGCNLVEINGEKMVTEEILYETCKAAAILATFQAGYTNFKYLDNITKEIFEHEALIGVSITGWLTNPDVLLNAEIQRKAADVVKYWNKYTAKLLGINPAARCTTSKPSGNSSVLLELIGYPGIKGTHANKFFRSMQINKSSNVAKLLKQELPDLLEESVWSSTKSDYVISLPIEAQISESTIMDKDIRGVESLKIVKLIQDNWIKYGKDVSLCLNPSASHNVSNTISVDGDWEKCIDFIYDNKESFTGISLFSATGDMDYCQAPYSTIKSAIELANEYGEGAILASGLIVDGLHAFDNNFWLACDTALGKGIDIESLESDLEAQINSVSNVKDLITDTMLSKYNDDNITDALKHTCNKNEDELCALCYYEDVDLQIEIDKNIKKAQLKIDWVKRFKKFTVNFVGGDLQKASHLLKYVYNIHKHERIKRALQEYDSVDWSKLDHSEIEADTMGAASCYGGACEI